MRIKLIQLNEISMTNESQLVLGCELNGHSHAVHFNSECGVLALEIVMNLLL
jgi:hypothetical protein